MHRSGGECRSCTVQLLMFLAEQKSYLVSARLTLWTGRVRFPQDHYKVRSACRAAECLAPCRPAVDELARLVEMDQEQEGSESSTGVFPGGGIVAVPDRIIKVARKHGIWMFKVQYQDSTIQREQGSPLSNVQLRDLVAASGSIYVMWNAQWIVDPQQGPTASSGGQSCNASIVSHNELCPMFSPAICR